MTGTSLGALKEPGAWKSEATEHAFYLATRGAARALDLEDTIGSVAQGMEADLVVLYLNSTPLIEYRMKYADSLEEALFVQMTLGDDRAVRLMLRGRACTRGAVQHGAATH
jgi:cytosine/adenosine deaminase-related metal-dependent hydrolase